MTLEAIKDRARRHELREEWVKALGLYLTVLEKEEGREEPDIGLYNRVGDLQVRLGDVEGAVHHYERAVELYLRAGLAQNAIAVCRKLLRNAPERAEMDLRMGRIRADQGFLMDAREHFLAYARAKRSRGEMESAEAVIEEFLTRVPADGEALRLLGELLVEGGRGEEVVQRLDALLLHLAEAGEVERREEVLALRRELIPDAPPPLEPEGREPEAVEEPSAEGASGTDGVEGDEAPQPPERAGEFERGRLLDPDEVPAADGGTVEGFESTALGPGFTLDEGLGPGPLHAPSGGNPRTGDGTREGGRAPGADRLREILDADPGNPVALESMGLRLLEGRDPEGAIRLLESGLDACRDPEEARLGVHYVLAKAHEAAGNTAEAREFYERIASVDIDFKDVRARLGALS